jgi:hypothetical protein
VNQNFSRPIAFTETACVSHFLLRNKTTGKFERITDPDKIEAAMNKLKNVYRI